MFYYTYILCCSDGSLYTGSTNNIEKRLHAHNHLNSWAHYTKIRRPVELIYQEQFTTMSEARKREYVIKQLSRSQKLALIRTIN
jgi:putative endonuclease